MREDCWLWQVESVTQLVLAVCEWRENLCSAVLFAQCPEQPTQVKCTGCQTASHQSFYALEAERLSPTTPLHTNRDCEFAPYFTELTATTPWLTERGPGEPCGICADRKPRSLSPGGDMLSALESFSCPPGVMLSLVGFIGVALSCLPSSGWPFLLDKDMERRRLSSI